jgi:spore maturation protein CgeB
MKFVLFYHSLVSDWNHGNAHFLRGIVRELVGLGQDVAVYEPHDSWSRRNLLREAGPQAVRQFEAAFPGLHSKRYTLDDAEIEQAVDGADVVIAHEWNHPDLIAKLGRLRADGADFRLLFHDTHHRSVTQPHEIAAFDLHAYDGVLAFGDVIRERYITQGWAHQAWTWHEAADTALFKPTPNGTMDGDLVWVGNWGDSERNAELEEFLIDPVRRLNLKAATYGVRYPDAARRALAAARIEYRGWLPNYRAPAVFGRYGFTVHIPRRPYLESLPGIPTIRVFEALACGIPMVSALWTDSAGLFGHDDFLVARTGAEMTDHLRALKEDAGLRTTLAANGLQTIRSRHTCRHRVLELLDICRKLGVTGNDGVQPRRHIA